MKLEQAQAITMLLRDTLRDDDYWGDIYYTTKDESQPQTEWEYEVYLEHLRPFELDKMGMIMPIIGNQTYVVAQLTRQIIIWG